MNLNDLRKQINTIPNPLTEDRTKVWFIDTTQRQILNDLIDKVERYESALKEIAEEPYGDADWLEIAIRYEGIAEDALKG